MNQDSACACSVPIIRGLHQQARDDASELIRVSNQTASEDAEISRFEIQNECLQYLCNEQRDNEILRNS